MGGGAARGQVMILTVMILGASMFAAASLTGYLLVLRLRESSDAANSAKAVFAADAGSEWALYRKYKVDSSDNDILKPTFSDPNVSFRVTPEDLGGLKAASDIKSVGGASDVYRAFQYSFGAP